MNMNQTHAEATTSVPPFLDFIFLLREYGILVGVRQVLDFYKGMEQGLVQSLDELFLYARLVFVKQVGQLDAFERAFSLYFHNIDLPAVAEGDPELLYTRQFRQWLEEAMARGHLPPGALWNMSRAELMAKFWETVRRQMEAHHGGNRWVGTGGSSPFGHSGLAQPGIRVFGQPGNRSAVKVIGDRRYIDYDAHNSLKGENIRQVLGDLRRMVPVGAADDLDLDETIHKTCRNGGDIDLVFKRHELDRIKLMLFIDNGGTSMWPHVQVTQLLFSKIRDRFADCRTFFFHNTIYRTVYQDARRRLPVPLEELLQQPPETRVFIMGDASMAPEELMYDDGAISMGEEERVPSIRRLEAIRDRFPFTVWLNPIHREEWATTYGSWTLARIREVIHMEELTHGGIKSAVAHLRRLAGSRA